MRQRDRTKGTGWQTVLAVAAQRGFNKYRVSRINRQNRLYLANRASLAGIAGLAQFPIDLWFVHIYEASWVIHFNKFLILSRMFVQGE